MTTRRIPKEERTFGFGDKPKRTRSVPKEERLLAAPVPVPTEGIIHPQPSQSTKPFDFSKGYFAQGRQASAFTGRPQTTAELQFIEDFVRQYGFRPSPFEQGFKELQHQGQYIPGSTMRDIYGFQSPSDYLRAQREGLQFGGLPTLGGAGSGGRIATAPLAPFQAPEPFAGDLTTHRSDTGLPDTIDPKTGATIAPVGDFWRNKDTYRHYANAIDAYLTRSVENNTIVEEDRELILQRADYLISIDTPANQLPLFNKILAETNPVIQKTYDEIFRENLDSSALQIAEREFATKQQSAESTRASAVRGRSGQGGEQQDYMELIRTVAFTPEEVEWLQSNYIYYYNAWVASGTGISFIGFVRQLLGQG